MLCKRIALGVLGALLSSGAYSGTVKIGAVVLDDETDLPMPNVEVCFSFKEDVGWRAWTESSKHHKTYCRTDSAGYCHTTGQSNCGQGGCYVKNPPDGYYHPALGWKNKFTSKNLFGVWQPDNLVATICLQRVEHPIPLCVKNVRPKVAPETFDGTNAVLRYDLVLGDWLPPEGKGERADLEIRTKLTVNEVLQVGRRRKKVFFEFRNEIEFTGEGNGFCAEMTVPTMGIKLRSAPEVGYGKTIVNRFGVKRKIVGPNVNEAEYSDANPNRCYYFRIRSRFDDKGNLVEAYYGKVYGDFNFHGDWYLGFQGFDFLYYLNPKSLDRNLEWDMKTNLCPTAGKHESQEP